MGQGREGTSISQHYSDTANLCWFGSQTLPSGRGKKTDPRNFINDSCEATNTNKLIARILTSLSHTLFVKPHVHTACSHEILFTTHTNLIFTLMKKQQMYTTEEVKLYENNNFSAVCQVLEII